MLKNEEQKKKKQMMQAAKLGRFLVAGRNSYASVMFQYDGKVTIKQQARLNN